MSLHELLVAPFADYAFMRRALIGSLALSVSAAPLGVFLLLRRMSLTGDAMAHAVLPGSAIGFLVAGLSLPAMAIGGLVAGLAVALLAGLVSRTTRLREDASLASFYLISLALGVVIVSMKGSSIDVLHVLFGSVLALDDTALLLMAAISSVTLAVLALIYRPLVLECLDPSFLGTVSRSGGPVHLAFLGLVVVNLVGGFQALGTLMVIGIMILPAAAARLWTGDITRMLALATLIGMASVVTGLLASYHLRSPTGPSIILAAGLFHILSILAGAVAKAVSDRSQADHRA